MPTAVHGHPTPPILSALKSRHPRPPKELDLGSLPDEYDWCLIEGYALHDLVKKQDLDPMCRATLEYLGWVRSLPIPADLLS